MRSGTVHARRTTVARTVLRNEARARGVSRHRSNHRGFQLGSIHHGKNKPESTANGPRVEAPNMDVPEYVHNNDHRSKNVAVVEDIVPHRNCLPRTNHTPRSTGPKNALMTAEALHFPTDRNGAGHSALWGEKTSATRGLKNVPNRTMIL